VTDDVLRCDEPAGGPVERAGGEEETVQSVEREAVMEVARVGEKAPDFTANAYHEGGFKQVSLSDYEGDWVMLCFYPGDFTFV